MTKKIVPSKRVKDLTGKIFNRLTVISFFGQNKRKEAVWNCLCICGKATLSVGSKLISGNTGSCGCYGSKRRAESNITHGKSKTPEFYVWCELRHRCTNKSDERYHRYGGRGISVCDRWNESFEHFISDVGLRPSSKHSIDRIDNDGNYEPENCKWSTATQQVINQGLSKRNKSGVSGVRLRLNKKYWESYISINKKRIYLGSSNDFFEAVCMRKSAEIVHHRPLLN